MSKEDALQIIKLLSAMESWAFSQQRDLPGYLVEGTSTAMSVLDRVVLEKTTVTF